jgi:hypothetical protein
MHAPLGRKPVILVIGALLVFVAGLVTGSTDLFRNVQYWYTHGRHETKVKAQLFLDRTMCVESHPIAVGFVNSSSKTVESIRFSLSARGPGRSSNLADYYFYVDDSILEPGQGRMRCWRQPNLNEKIDDPAKLNWSVNIEKVQFAD